MASWIGDRSHSWLKAMKILCSFQGDVVESNKNKFQFYLHVIKCSISKGITLIKCLIIKRFYSIQKRPETVDGDFLPLSLTCIREQQKLRIRHLKMQSMSAAVCPSTEHGRDATPR